MYSHATHSKKSCTSIDLNAAEFGEIEVCVGVCLFLCMSTYVRVCTPCAFAESGEIKVYFMCMCVYTRVCMRVRTCVCMYECSHHVPLLVPVRETLCACACVCVIVYIYTFIYLHTCLS